MNQGLPTIEDMAKRFLSAGALSQEQLKEFKALELASLSSERKEDALLLLARLVDTDPAKIAMMRGLEYLRAWMHERIKRAEQKEVPVLYLISGVPGAGKSVMLDGLAKCNENLLIASADDFKSEFKKNLPDFIGQTPEPTRSRLESSAYIHRLTALPSWEMVDEAIEAKVDLAVEMLGIGASEDARTLRRALSKGYRVEVHHVGCSVEVALGRAAKRYFDQKGQGLPSRWIGLAQSAAKQRTIASSFAQLCELMRTSEAKFFLYDNSEMAMSLVWTSNEGAGPPMELFNTWAHDHRLWRSGPNPAADLCVFHKESDHLYVALVERANPPCAGQWAFPGGFISSTAGAEGFEWGAEKAKAAALRRFSEETLSQGVPVEVKFIGKFDALDRDPRNSENRWVEEWLFSAHLVHQEPLAAGDAVNAARWVDVQDIFNGNISLAFDHWALLQRALRAEGYPCRAKKVRTET